MNQNPLDVSLCRAQGLTDDVIIHDFQHSFPPAVDPDGELGANEGDAGGVDPIQEGKCALLDKFRPHFIEGSAHQISQSPGLVNEWIGELEAMLRAT